MSDSELSECESVDILPPCFKPRESMMNSTSFITVNSPESAPQPQRDQEAKILSHFKDSLQDKIDLFVEEFQTKEESLQSLYDYIQDQLTKVESLPTEINLRLTQAIINRWDNRVSLRSGRKPLLDLTQELMEEFEQISNIDEVDYTRKLLALLNPFIKDVNEKINESNVAQHRNVCLALIVNLECNQYKLGAGEREQLFVYLEKIIRESGGGEAVLFGCLVLELLAWKQQISKELISNLRLSLQKYIDFIHQCPLPILSSPNFDRIKFQIGQLAHSLLTTILIDPQPSTLTLIKLSPDQLSARSDQYGEYPTVISSFPVIDEVFFYEATILTSGRMVIGWATRETDFNDGIGFNPHSIGFDGANRRIFHKNSQIKTDNQNWKEGEIVGCLINVPEKRFQFYLNGKPLETISAHFSAQAYYAVAQLSAHQQISFNFGQVGFKYPPKGVRFTDFNTKSSNQDFKLQIPTQLPDGKYWYKSEPKNNKIEPLFRDQKQFQFDRWIIKLSCKIADKTTNKENWFQSLEEEFTALMKDSQAIYRLIQAIIEELDSRVSESQLEIIVELIEEFINLLEKVDLSLNIPKLLELIYPYLKLKSKCNCDKVAIKQRNLCIILSLMRKFDHEEVSEFLSNEEVISFLSFIIKESEVEQNQLQAIVALDQVNPEVGLREKFEVNLREKATFLEKSNLELLYTPTFNFKRYEIGFCARWLLDQLAPPVSPKNKPSTQTEATEKSKLDLKTKTFNLKVSKDRLCARSDSNWQSISSVFPITSGIYFYEAILLTSGSMIIGWATKECEFQEGKSVGNDEYSIGYDGHQKKICHIYGDYTLLKGNVREWKAGDVVGCLIDVPKKQFSFYLNGEAIEYQTEIFFSPQPYFAAISLGARQQVYFNFGQEDFKFPPEDIGGELRNFFNSTSSNCCPFCSEKNAEYRFAKCDHWTVCLDCLSRLKKCPTCCPTQELAQ